MRYQPSMPELIFPISSFFTGAITCLLLYITSLYISRLIFHPLAGIPGPKFAALTYWYEIYYDVFYRGGGKYPFKIQQLHKKYGNIRTHSKPYEKLF
jgi:hypothetical protein